MFGQKVFFAGTFLLILILFSSIVFAGPEISDANLLDTTEAQAANYFYEQSMSNGFVKDTTAKSFSSIAATGFGLASFTVMAQRYNSTPNWIYSPAQLRDRTNIILGNILALQNLQSQNPAQYGTHGLLFHFIDDQNRPANNDGVSTIDNALLFAGVITAGEYFGGEVKQKADLIVSRADWNYFLKTPQNDFPTSGGTSNYYQFSMAWNGSVSPNTWNLPTDEAILISLLAIARDPNNTDYKKSLFSWPRMVRSYAGFNVINSFRGSLFTYEFAHAFIDFNLIGKDNPAVITSGVSAVDWWQNSINAAKANRQFVIDNSGTYSSYGPDSWGLSAVERPNTSYYGDNGAAPSDYPPIHDGTIAPYSSISAMPFFKDDDNGVLTNNLSFRVLRNLYDTRYDSLWGAYGPKESFNSQNQYSAIYSGINEGDIVLMLENYRTGFVWSQFMKNNSIKAAIAQVFSCPEGICDQNIPVCNVNSDCGFDGFVGTNFCQGVNPQSSVYKTYRQFTCSAPGTPQASCQITDNNQFQFSCLSSQQCVAGLCITPAGAGNGCVDPVQNAQLDASVTFCGGGGNIPINIVGNNVTLDCNNTQLSTIQLSGRDNVTIKNCRLSGGNYSIKIDQSTNVSVIDNNLMGTWDWGLYASSSSNLRIANNNIKSNTYRSGIALINSHNNYVENNLISDNGNTQIPWYYAGGVYLSNSANNSFSNNTFVDNRRSFYVENSTNNTFSYNNVCTNYNDSYSNSAQNTGYGNKVPQGYGSSTPYLLTSAIDCPCSAQAFGTTYQSWKEYKFKPWEWPADQNISRETDDPDGDGINNLAEYALCLEPKIASSKGLPTYAIEGGYFTLAYQRIMNSSDLNFAVLLSRDLFNWTSNTHLLSISNNGVKEKVKVSDNTPVANSASGYMRLVITENNTAPIHPLAKLSARPAPVCSTDLDCGYNMFIDNSKSCLDNSVFQTFRTFTCNNPGTSSASCSQVDANQKVKDCAIGCLEGACLLDTTSPTLIINSPADGYSTDNNSPVIEFTASDNADANLSYTILVDGLIDSTGIDQNAVLISAALSQQALGARTIMVIVADSAGNDTNASITINIVAPDAPVITSPPLGGSPSSYASTPSPTPKTSPDVNNSPDENAPVANSSPSQAQNNSPPIIDTSIFPASQKESPVETPAQTPSPPTGLFGFFENSITSLPIIALVLMALVIIGFVLIRKRN